MTHKEALTLALEALKRITHRFDLESVTEDAAKAITAAEEALAQPEQEPFGYFKAEPFGWTDCAETDDGAIALYDRPQRKEPEQEPVTLYKNIPTFYVRDVNGAYVEDNPLNYYTTPPQRKPQFKEFIKWAGAQGYDCAQTCNSDTGEWIVLHPMTADLWKCWQAAQGKEGA